MHLSLVKYSQRTLWGKQKESTKTKDRHYLYIIIVEPFHSLFEILNWYFKQLNIFV